MSIHRIHLRGPWDYNLNTQSQGRRNSESLGGTASMPQHWQTLFGDSAGIAQFRRKFHRPTNLDPSERVMIVFTEVRGNGQIQLNGVPVGPFASSGDLIEFDVTRVLKPFNELVVEISFDPHEAAGLPGGLFGVAALEIRSE